VILTGQETLFFILQGMLAGNRVDLCRVPMMTRDCHRIPVETRVMKGEWNGKPALFGVSKGLRWPVNDSPGFPLDIPEHLPAGKRLLRFTS
jgi:hypothetical protein